MGIVDDYLNSDSAKTVAPEVKSSSLVDQYLNAPEAKPLASKTVAPVRPPISGVDKVSSDEINAQPAKAGGANPRDSALSEGIAAAPGNVGRAIGEDFKAGLDTIGSGAQDILANKPASGIGKVGLGALSAAVSPISGLARKGGDAVDTIVGKPNDDVPRDLAGNALSDKPVVTASLGQRVAEIATSGLPIARAAKATVAALPKNRALSTLVESIGPENLPEVVRQMKANPRLTPADLSANVKQDVQSLFVTDGPHINYIDQRVKERAAGAKGAVEGAMDASLGGTVNAVDKLAELKQNIKDVGSKKINPALENTGPVNVKPVIDEIDKILKPGVNSVISNDTQLSSPEIIKGLEVVKQYLTDGTSMRTDPKSLHDVQKMLRARADKLSNSASGQDREIGHALMKVRNDIVTAIDASGKVKTSELPPTLRSGPASISTTPIKDKTLYHETSAENAANFLKDDLSNNVDKVRNGNLFLTDNKDLAIGQQGKGITLEFNGNLVSGKEHVKPGTGDLTGREYKANAFGNNAVTAINVAPGEKLSLPQSWQNRLDKEFAKTELPDGSIRYERNAEKNSSGYKQALSDYRDEFHIQDAFEHGHDAIITNSKAITNRPEFFKQWVKNASPEELNAAKEGARVAIDTAIHGFRSPATNPSSKAVQLSQVDFNRQRIETLFGKEEADKLFTKLDHERQIADTNNKLIEGSQTAMRVASKAKFAMPTKSDVGKSIVPAVIVEGASLLGSGTPGVGTALYAGMKAATTAKDAIAMKVAREHSARYAQYALPTEGPSREELIKSLEAIANKPVKQSLARRAVSKGVRLGSLIAP